MDKKLFGAKLRELRIQSGFPKPHDLTKASGVHVQTIELTEAGTRWPRLDLLDMWLKACGLSLAAFFADLQPEDAPDPKSTVAITVKRKNKESHEKYEALLNHDDSLIATAIKQNVTTFHDHHVSRKRRDPKEAIS